MAIQLSQTPFGNYTCYTLGNSETHISFIPERSAYIHQIRLQGRDLLWNYPSGAELTKNSGHRNLALLPFPNRLLEGSYAWNNRPLAFEVNKPASRSALHGFGPNAPFIIESKDLSGQNVKVKLTFLHRPEEHPLSYPFFVRFEVLLAVDTKSHTATWELRATNLGEASAPVGLGWHPYFLIPGGHEQWSVQMPPIEQVILKNAIPTGERSKGLSSKEPFPINVAWDDCFALTDNADREVRLIGSDYSLSLKQTGQTRYTQLYVPEGKESVAIEPMSCNVNAFNTDREEVAVAAGGTVATGMMISLI